MFLFFFLPFCPKLQYVSVENELSSFKKCDCGVSHGSVPGPLLFTMYINDISSSVTNSPRLFADDTCLILQDKDLNTLHIKVTAEISSVSNSMAANKLTLNVAKSHVIVVEPNSRNSEQKLTLSVTHITQGLTTVKCTKYLGIILDDQLSFNAHIDMLTKKLSRAVGSLCKLQSFLNKTRLLDLYYALFHSRIQYGLITRSATCKSYYNKVFEVACYLHGTNTRISRFDNFFLPHYRTNKLQKSNKFQDPKVWDSIEASIKQFKSTKISKKKLKCFLLKTYLNCALKN